MAGLLLTAIQQLEIAPLIRQAEAFEAGPAGEAPSPLLTAAANVVLATGFALLLAVAISLPKRTGWRWGLLWGLAGYAAFFVAPAIWMPPELPGAAPAALTQDFIRAAYVANVIFWLTLGAVAGALDKLGRET